MVRFIGTDFLVQAFFNAMLQDLDAKALKVQEVFALDDRALADLP